MCIREIHFAYVFFCVYKNGLHLFMASNVSRDFVVTIDITTIM